MSITLTDAKVLNICLKKAGHPEILNFQELAWDRMLQMYDHYLKKAVDDKGIIISDESNEHQLRNQLRASRNQCDNPVLNIIEDVSYRKSNLSYIIQTCDAIAYCLYLKEYPKGSLKKHRTEKIFDTLKPMLLHQPSILDPFGVVRN